MLFLRLLHVRLVAVAVAIPLSSTILRSQEFEAEDATMMVYLVSRDGGRADIWIQSQKLISLVFVVLERNHLVADGVTLALDDLHNWL